MAFTPRINENGRICCSHEKYLCDTCKAHFARLAIQDTSDDEYGPYTADVRAMRAANATPESRACEQYQAARLRDLAAEDATVATLRAAHAARMQPSSDLDRYEPPNPYANDLKAFQEAAR